MPGFVEKPNILNHMNMAWEFFLMHSCFESLLQLKLQETLPSVTFPEMNMFCSVFVERSIVLNRARLRTC